MENLFSGSSNLFLSNLLNTFSGFTYVVHGILLLISAVLLFSLLIVYKSIRKRFPVKVNCWFCNNYTKVPYDLSNSWDCPHCKQYNGFTKDGGYNKVIKEQYNAKLNDDMFSALKTSFSCNKKSLQTNGFCKLCNINQQLKIQQLALFVPLDENNYSEEIEQYREKLEKAYKLCSFCERTLQETLEKQEYLLLKDRLNGHKQSKLVQKPKSIINLKGGDILNYLKKNGGRGLGWTCFAVSSLLLLALLVQFETEQKVLYQTLPHIAILEPLRPILKVGFGWARKIYGYGRELSFVGFVCCLLKLLEGQNKQNHIVLLVWGLVHILLWSKLTGFQVVMGGVSVFLNSRAVRSNPICLNKKSLPKKSGFQPVKQVFPDIYNLSGEEIPEEWPKSRSSFGGTPEESPLKENMEDSRKSTMEGVKRRIRKKENEVEVPASEEPENQEPRTTEASPGGKASGSGSSVFSKQFLSTLENDKNEEGSGSFSEVYNGLNGLKLGEKQKKSNKATNFLFTNQNFSEGRCSASIIKPAKFIKNLGSSWTCTESNDCGSRSSTPSSGYSSQKAEPKIEPTRYEFAKTLSPIAIPPFGRHSPQECFDYYGANNGFYNNFNYCPPGFVPFPHGPMGHTTIYTCTRPTNFPFPFPTWQGFPPTSPKLSPNPRFSDASDCDNLFQNASKSFENDRKWFKLKTFSYYLSIFLNCITLLGLFYFISAGIISVDWKLPHLNFSF